jgi:hypothetical protein
MNIIIVILYIPDIHVLRPLNYMIKLTECHSLTRGGKSTLKLCNCTKMYSIHCKNAATHCQNENRNYTHLCINWPFSFLFWTAKKYQQIRVLRNVHYFLKKTLEMSAFTCVWNWFYTPRRFHKAYYPSAWPIKFTHHFWCCIRPKPSKGKQ